MSTIVPITGRVQFQIVLDPSSWIFDHRKIELNDYLTETITIQDVLGHNRDERAGAAMPRMIETGVKYEKDKWLTDSFVIPIAPFLSNAEPLEDASLVHLLSEDGEEITTLPITVFKEGVFCFSKNGKILKEEGPLQFYNLDDYHDEPIGGISKIVLA
ncbi:peptidyl-prolyl cis-trans isomerase [Pullulanibacillus sp. KACC 23026]|uniref:peptidyl-prolyl cis-trans isomerase n=1 Tax=Pullulanibacillus sp. KACC 23026 TaxID=3028315 RepID=UPI0023B0E9EE|nr:peptidyl-prolyl cis-trans isomerase [Pullulanibacillus sp. KACC 23026]WEG11711.1 peptidyl-prolyl cis-trans isomerase [Pullulanibacillus sp. KACC 23026]